MKLNENKIIWYVITQNNRTQIKTPSNSTQKKSQLSKNSQFYYTSSNLA